MKIHTKRGHHEGDEAADPRRRPLPARLVGACRREESDNAKLAVGTWDIIKSHEGGPPKGGVVEFTKDGKIKVSGEQNGMKQAFEGTYKIGDSENSVDLTIDRLDETTFATTSKNGKVELTRKKK